VYRCRISASIQSPPPSRYLSSSWPASAHRHRCVISAPLKLSGIAIELIHANANCVNTPRHRCRISAAIHSSPPSRRLIISTKQARRRRFVISAPVNLTVVAVEFVHANANCVNTPRHRRRISATTYSLIHLLVRLIILTPTLLIHFNNLTFTPAYYSNLNFRQPSSLWLVRIVLCYVVGS